VIFAGVGQCIGFTSVIWHSLLVVWQERHPAWKSLYR